jgi:acetyltransferase
MSPAGGTAPHPAALVSIGGDGLALGTRHGLPMPRPRRPCEQPRRGEALLPGHETHGLRDGRTVTVRPVHADDAAAEQRLVSALLSPRSRLLRFHGAVKQLPPGLLRDMTQVDQRCHVAIVAETRADDGAAWLVGDARYVVSDDDPLAAEFAIAVADDWQRLGLGRRLLQRLAAHAGRAGLRRLDGSVLAGNEPMLALLRQLGATMRLDPASADTVIATLGV